MNSPDRRNRIVRMMRTSGALGLAVAMLVGWFGSVPVGRDVSARRAGMPIAARGDPTPSPYRGGDIELTVEIEEELRDDVSGLHAPAVASPWADGLRERAPQARDPAEVDDRTRAGVRKRTRNRGPPPGIRACA